LVAELAEARQAADELARTVERVPRLEKEFAEIDGLLASGDARTPPSLDNLRVASPCRADWDGMVRGDRLRFCAQCGKNFYNLSGMAREEAEAFLQIEAASCVRFFRERMARCLRAIAPSACAASESTPPWRWGSACCGVAGLRDDIGSITTADGAVVDRSHAAERVRLGATRAGQAAEGIVLNALPIMEPDDVKPANLKPGIADEKGCSAPYTVGARGKRVSKLECL